MKMTWPVLVTGGAGYIGSHACKALAAAGYTPVTYDSLATGWREAVQFGPFETGDLRDRERLDAVAWGLVGGLSFLVLLTGYELATGFRVGLGLKLGVALLVTVVAALGGAYIASRARARRRENERA